MVLNRFNYRKSSFNGRKFIFVLLIVTTAEFCEEGQFEAGWLFGCADCPKEPGKYCRYEGEYTENCKTSCIPKEVTSIKPEIKPNTGSIIKIAIPIGISFGAVLLIIIAFLVFLWYRTNSNSGRAVENADGIETQSDVNRHLDAEEDQPQVEAAAEVRLLVPGTLFDLNTRKENEQL